MSGAGSGQALGLWLSAANVFIRDLSVALPNVLTMVMFATPIFYPIESLPGPLQQVSRFNPFYILVSAYRAVLLDRVAPAWAGLLFVLLVALAVGAGGLMIFRRESRLPHGQMILLPSKWHGMASSLLE